MSVEIAQLVKTVNDVARIINNHHYGMQNVYDCEDVKIYYDDMEFDGILWNAKNELYCNTDDYAKLYYKLGLIDKPLFARIVELLYDEDPNVIAENIIHMKKLSIKDELYEEI